MRHNQRRSEIGKMLVDIAKYVATIGIIGGLITDKLSPKTAIFGIVSIVLLLFVAFFVMPANKEELR